MKPMGKRFGNQKNFFTLTRSLISTSGKIDRTLDADLVADQW
jgi:hypothetical protein